MRAVISTCTWGGGEPRRCPVCRHVSWVAPSVTAGDAPCPTCGHLLWPDDRLAWRVLGGGRLVLDAAGRVVSSVAKPRLRSRPRPSLPTFRAALWSAVVLARSAIRVATAPRPVEPTRSGVYDRWLDG
jgi:hypothetical protein